MKTRTVLITGVAGFIGFHLARHLLSQGWDVVGLDNVNDYYRTSLKKDRLNHLRRHPESSRFHFLEEDLCNKEIWKDIEGKARRPDVVIHLAAQAGVRYSTTHPFAYTASNIEGFLNVLEYCRELGKTPLLFASSSSVYGMNQKVPFCETDPVDHPTSLYAATKRANELMAHSYSLQYDLPTVGLRFFTVYGPWGRPDMAVFSFAESILDGREITVFDYGQLRRDFTFIDDIVEGISLLVDNLEGAFIQSEDNATAKNSQPDRSSVQYRIFNIGNSHPVSVMELLSELEKHLGKKARLKFSAAPKSDVDITFASTAELHSLTGFQPRTSISDGLKEFVDWLLQYRSYGTDTLC